MTQPYLPCVEIEPRDPAQTAVIWLHGLGADGHDFEPLVPYLGVHESLRTRFVFPHAPRRPVSINMGMIMPAWYDIRVVDLNRGQDEKGIRESASFVADLIRREEARGVPPGRVVLAGFSQGGAIALHVALRYPARLAGCIGLSCYVVLADRLDKERHPANHALPIFLAHGLMDPMVPLEAAEAARDLLSSLGYPVEWHTYNMGHEVHPDEIRDIGSFLNRRLGQAMEEAPQP